MSTCRCYEDPEAWREAAQAEQSRAVDDNLWHGDLNEVLHALAGKEPCESGCVHYVDDLIGKWTLLGLANVASRAVEPSDGQ